MVHPKIVENVFFLFLNKIKKKASLTFSRNFFEIFFVPGKSPIFLNEFYASSILFNVSKRRKDKKKEEMSKKYSFYFLFLSFHKHTHKITITTKHKQTNLEYAFNLIRIDESCLVKNLFILICVHIFFLLPYFRFDVLFNQTSFSL